MNKIAFAIIFLVIISGSFVIFAVNDQFVIAKSNKKVDFTQTITSSQDPGQGHEGHQLAIILAPNQGSLYDGSLTYTASEPVEIVVLHEIGKQESKGQPTWTVDGKTTYGLTLVEPGTNAGSFEFTGAALALHNKKGQAFTATVSVDGWIRGQPTEIILERIQPEVEEQSIRLARANVNATIPMHKGFFDGGTIYYIITDSNGEKHAELISKKQNWKVELAPSLSSMPPESLSKVYMFTNGIYGLGIHGFQNEVFSSTPSQIKEYSAIHSVIHVEWKKGQVPEILDSEKAILKAEQGGRVKLETTEAVINMPQIIWLDGQMKVRENATISDDMSYGEGQVIEINKEKMSVTFVAHRGWGPDGRTIYYIVTDATPTGPAEMMGVVDAPTLAHALTSPAAIDLYQFKNGFKGSGPLGFQPGIAASAPGDETYSPLWRISLIEWTDPENVSILENIGDVNAKRTDGEISVTLARPMNSDHIVNCPFVDPFQ